MFSEQLPLWREVCWCILIAFFYPGWSSHVMGYAENSICSAQQNMTGVPSDSRVCGFCFFFFFYFFFIPCYQTASFMLFYSASVRLLDPFCVTWSRLAALRQSEWYQQVWKQVGNSTCVPVLTASLTYVQQSRSVCESISKDYSPPSSPLFLFPFLPLSFSVSLKRSATSAGHNPSEYLRAVAEFRLDLRNTDRLHHPAGPLNLCEIVVSAAWHYCHPRRHYPSLSVPLFLLVWRHFFSTQYHTLDQSMFKNRHSDSICVI